MGRGALDHRRGKSYGKEAKRMPRKKHVAILREREREREMGLALVGIKGGQKRILVVLTADDKKGRKGG